MIYDELGRSFVAGADGPEAVEMVSPRELLIGLEAGLVADDVGAVRLEAVRALHVWLMECGPHPREVAERLVTATRHYAPKLVNNLAAGDIVAVAAADADLRHRSLMRVLLADPRARTAKRRRHAERIQGVLAKAFRREEHTAAPAREGSGLDRLIQADEAAGIEECQCRRDAVRAWLRMMWQAAALLAALKACFALTRGFWPELVLNMTGEEIASFFVQTRAAESERVHRLINRPIERSVGRHTTLRFQKSTVACGKYARAAAGNTHRADSVLRAA